MNNNSKKTRFVIVDLSLIDAGLTYEEAALVAYVERFTKSGATCYAAIPYIATDLRLSERTVRRCLNSLLQSNFLIAKKKGRGRILERATAAKLATMNAAKMATMTPANLATNSGQSVTDCGQNGRSDCGQNGRLYNNRSTNININNNYLNNNLLKSTITRARETDPFEEDEILDKDGWPERF